MKINEDWEELKEESEKNVLSKKGIKKQTNPINPDRRPFWGYQRK